MRPRKYLNILRPSVDYLRQVDKLLLEPREVGEFLGVDPKTIQQLVYSDRIPLPVSLGLGECHRWSVIELLEWVEAGCPRRTEWIATRGQSGWFPHWRTKPR
jgi:predicted DNA-binding transcriptional regulator AlpA